MVSLERQALMFQPAHLRPALRRGAVTYLLVFCMVVGAVTLYLLATATANTAMFAQQYPLLLALNGGLAACLAALSPAASGEARLAHAASSPAGCAP
jgi:hypothetical protein